MYNLIPVKTTLNTDEGTDGVTVTPRRASPSSASFAPNANANTYSGAAHGASEASMASGNDRRVIPAEDVAFSRHPPPWNGLRRSPSPFPSDWILKVLSLCWIPLLGKVRVRTDGRLRCLRVSSALQHGEWATCAKVEAGLILSPQSIILISPHPPDTMIGQDLAGRPRQRLAQAIV